MTISPAAREPEAAPHSPVRLIKGLQADYAPAPDYPGRNVSGFLPLGPNVVVCVDTCSSATAGGVMLTDDMVDKMDLASVSGVIYAIGKTAWRGYDTEERPALGDRIYFEKYAGLHGRGRDGKLYRIMDDRCIACLIDTGEDGAAPAAVGM